MKQHTILRPHGYMIMTGPGGAVIEADTLQCVHCGRHWAVSPESRRMTGYCHTCNGPVCSARCAECVPAEQQLENMEQHRPINHRRIIVPT